ncbi:hypothetical protein NIES4101_25090 (plasmid) [Calothrix sp. NIES-4101]|nr:hypothetical protein NIES4101_25090 [Calothrix sp. NIES-4101]
MDDIQKLIAIQQELEQIGERLGELFKTDHPQFNDVFEDIGAAGYYIQEAGYRLESAKRTLQGAEEDEN